MGKSVSAAKSSRRRRDSIATVGGKGNENANLAVYTSIRLALLSGKIPVGQKLQEPAIARALQVSRERVRKAIHRLAHEHWVNLVPNRGAYARVPTIEEIEDISQARRILEGGTVRLLTKLRDPRAIARLEEHVAAERAAASVRDRAELISLSAAFHVLICELAGNQQLLRFQSEMMSISQLFYALFAPLDLPSCGGPDEHSAIVAAIRAGKEQGAVKLMDEHLRENLAHFRHHRPSTAFVGFDAVFAPLGRM